jgi:hypothetical protein
LKPATMSGLEIVRQPPMLFLKSTTSPWRVVSVPFLYDKEHVFLKGWPGRKYPLKMHGASWSQHEPTTEEP